VQNYGVIAQPLTQLKKEAFKWNNEVEQAFEHLKHAMTQVPVLALPDFSKKNLLLNVMLREWVLEPS
jgi:hypothetical protein